MHSFSRTEARIRPRRQNTRFEVSLRGASSVASAKGNSKLARFVIAATVAEFLPHRPEFVALAQARGRPSRKSPAQIESVRTLWARIVALATP